jgi:4-amino-4-deoxy-L-arabinose transferase-like glycosyltransferase
MVSEPAGGLRGRPLLCGLVVFFAALALYARTLLPGVGFWDTAEFQTVGPVLGIAHPTGYPTYTLLAWLASVVLQPIGEPALRANLLSALLVAAAAGLVAACVAAVGRRALAGLVAGLALAVAPAAWTIGLRADAHALNLAFVALLLALLVGWAQRTSAGHGGDGWLLAAAVAFGLSLGNHALTVLLAPGIALYVLAVAPRLPIQRPLFVASCALALLLATTLVYAYLPLRSAMNPPLDYGNPQTWEGFRYVILAEQFQGSFRGLPPAAEAVAQVIGETFSELGVVALLAIAGVVHLVRRRSSLLVLLAAWFVTGWLIALTYVNADIERYYLMPLLAVAVLGGIGLAALLDLAVIGWHHLAAWQPDGALLRGRVLRFVRPLTAVSLAALLLAPTLLAVPSRIGQLDQSGSTFGRDWLAEALPQLESDAVVISWWAFSTALWYAQFVEGRRTDLLVLDDSTIYQHGLANADRAIAAYLPDRPVYLLRLPEDIAHFERAYQLEPLWLPEWGMAFRVVGPGAVR